MIRIASRRRFAAGVIGSAILFCAYGAFAAANVVPETAVDDVSQSIQITPVVPADCLSFKLDNTIYGNGIILGTNGSDLMFGGSGPDTMTGLNQKDCMLGGAGNDIMDGGNAGDVLFGGDGNDTLNGGLGPDICYGGPGTDIFIGCETAVQ